MAGKKQEGLTPTQAKVLKFIAGFAQKNGYAPSLEEIATKFEWLNASSASYMLAQLEAKGMIKRAPKKQRAITITTKGKKHG